MTDVHRRPPSSSRLSPEEIINRGFASAFRGVSETEVRNFLRRIADDLSAMRAREAELNRQIEDLQEQLANPPPVTEQQLLAALGEETARVLRSAQDAAEDMRKRAEERGAQVVAEAKDAAAKIREEAEQQASTRTEEAERRATELETEAGTRATEQREAAERDAAELRESTTREIEALRESAEQAAADEAEAAKTTSFALVDEARTVRERVLSDLARRRSLLQAQVDELRSGRDRLLDAYRVVKHTLGDATVALAQVETRANAELAAPPPRVTVPPVEGELEALQFGPDGVSPVAAGDDDGAVDIDLEGESVVVLDEGAGRAGPEAGGGRVTPDSEDSGAAVDALFARLRASHTADPAPGVPLPPVAEVSPTADDAPTPSAPTPSDAGDPKDSGPKDSGPKDAGPKNGGPKNGAPKDAAPKGSTSKPSARKPSARKDERATATPDASEPETPVALTGDDARRAARDEVLGPVTHDLGRRAKRALQDQQNEILDKIRTVKGKVTAAAVLPAEADQESAWSAVLREPLAAAYTHSYREAAGPDRPGPELPPGMVDDLARVMVVPWRERLVSAIDGAGDDSDAITQRLGSRYREYRGRELDDALGDALAATWAAGTFDAVPDGTLLRWVPAQVGRCPDCDDNSLEPTARSEPFPTGQRFPPAHPGCRCFLALAEPDRRDG